MAKINKSIRITKGNMKTIKVFMLPYLFEMENGKIKVLNLEIRSM